MELVRIVRKSLLCIVCLFIAMICISLYQINYNQDSKVYKYYKEIIADYNNIKNDNVAFTAEKLTKTYEQYKEEDSEYIEEAAGLIKEKEKYIESYNADNQSKNYNRILQSTLFGNDNSFYILNANKQIKDKENRPSVDVEMVNTTAVEKLVTNRTMPLLYIIIFTVIIIYFTEETDNGVLVLVRTSRRGRVLLPIVRCGIIIIYNIVLSFLYNGILYAIYARVYGISGGAYIQNSKLFNMFPYAISINQFFVLYCLVYALAMFTIGLFIYFVINLISNYKVAVTLVIVIFLCEYLLYNKIQYNSQFNALKYINIINILFSGTSYLVYENWGTNGFIADISTTTFVMTAVIFLISLVGNIVVYSSKHTIRKKNIIDIMLDKIHILIQKLMYKMALLLMEIYKTLVIQKGILFIIVLVYVLMTFKIQRGVDYTNTNYMVNKFYKEFDGRAPDEDVEAYITDLRDELEEAKQDEAAMLYKKEELLKEQRNIDVMQTAVDYVNEINDNRSASAVIVNPANYNDILGERMYSSNESVNFISIIIVILLFAGDYAFERQNKMTAHIRSSKGRVRLWNNKMLKVFIITTLLWLISTIINVHNISDRYVYNQLTQSIWCLQMFKDFPVNISILAYIIWCSVYRLIWMLVVAFTAYIISYRFSYKVSLMVSFVMLIPHVIYILGVNWAQKLSIVVGMDINRLFNTYGYNVKSIILLIVVFVIMLVIACATYRKNIK